MDGFDDTVRVDCSAALSHGVDFRIADGPVEGMDLAVNIAFANIVEVDESELADSGAGKGFHNPRPYATDPDDADMRLAKDF